jgi:transposase
MKRVSSEVEAEILRHRLVEKWSIGTIATQLSIHHDVVRRVLSQHGLPAPVVLCRTRLADPYIEFLQETLSKYPCLHATRLHQMVQERGYPGGVSHLRRVVAQLRPRKAPEPFLRLSKLPAEEAQVDWGHFGEVQVGRGRRKLYAFVMTLSWSRMIWLEFFFDMQMANFLQGHVHGLSFFGGTPRKLLYDNLKSAVIDRDSSSIRFNDRLLQLATHYGFEPRAAAPRRGNEKGRVERSIRYVRDNFFAARDFYDIERLNQEARAWSERLSAARKWPQDDTRLVGDVFEEERQKLRRLPNDAFPTAERKVVSVGRTPWIRFDKNDYSVPAKYVRRKVDVLACHRTIRIVVDGELVAEHERSFDRRASIEDPAHTDELRKYKRKAREASAGERLRAACPSVEEFLSRASDRGHNMGGLISNLLTLLDTYGADILEAQVVAVNGQEVTSVNAIRLLLEQEVRAAGRTPPMEVRLPREDLANLEVAEVDLSQYDIKEESEHDTNKETDS